MSLFKRTASENQKTVEKDTGVELKHLNAQDFEELITKSDIPVVVDFWAEWCGPCHMISPSVKNLAGEYSGRAVVAKLNADDYPEILSRYGIMGIPTLIYFKGGQEQDRVIGLTGYGTLKSKLERLLA